jgi:exodeoxyribonuclease VII small subunit
MMDSSKPQLEKLPMTQNNEHPFSFEQAYARLEEILEQMNSGKVSLDESLKLYEEADRLIASCNSRLNEAEQKIESLIKNRNGELAMGENDKPMTQPFSPDARSVLAAKIANVADESECPF